MLVSASSRNQLSRLPLLYVAKFVNPAYTSRYFWKIISSLSSSFISLVSICHTTDPYVKILLNYASIFFENKRMSVD